MRIGLVRLGAWFVFGLCGVAAQGIQTSTPEPRFDAVSIKRNVSSSRNSDWANRPDGGFSATNIRADLLVARAYPPSIPLDLVGMPEWTRDERYDVIATSSLSHATADDRAAMLRGMLAERFKLIAHAENREQPVYDLVFARDDRKLGPGLTPTEIDCEAQLAAEQVAAAAQNRPLARPDRNGPPPRCKLRMVDDRFEGDTTMANLAMALRPFARRPIVDKTGLAGFYRVTMIFDPVALLRSPDSAVVSRAPSIFTAIQEDLGLRLKPSRQAVAAIVIDHIERPTAN
jgi:uncharacterized protein (TIGR03435 family)